MKNAVFYAALLFILPGVVAAFSVRTSASLAEEFIPNVVNTTPGALKEGTAHVQGICCNEEAIFVVFANYIYKLDWSGNVDKSVPATKHSGDPCIVNDKLYVSMSCDEQIAVFEYDLDLNLTKKIKLTDCPACDGIAFYDGQFYIGGPSVRTPHEDNLVHIYDSDWNLVKKGFINFGVKTDYGPQSICAWDGKIFYAFYPSKDNPKDSPRSVCVDSELNNIATFQLDGSNGWTLAPTSKQPQNPEQKLFLVARTKTVDGQTCAQFRWYLFDNKELAFKDVTVEKKER